MDKLSASVTVGGARGKAQAMGFINSLRSDIESRPVVFWALFGAGGIALYFKLRCEPTLSSLALFYVFGLSFAAAYHRRDDITVICPAPFRNFLRISLIAVPALCAGFIYASLHMRSLETQFIEGPLYTALSGRVVGIDQSSSGKTRYMLEDVYLYARDEAIKDKVRISASKTSLKFYQPKVGDRVSAMAYLMPPSGPSEPEAFDFRLYAYAKSLAAVGAVRGAVVVVDRQETSWAQRVSDDLTARFQANMPPREAAFASAIFTGRRDNMPIEILETMRETNLAHLLAISGLHVGLLAAIVFFILRNAVNAIPALRHRLHGKKVAAIGVAAVVIAYLFITGASLSTQRAVIMALVALVAIVLDLRVMSLRMVAIAFLIVVAIDPYAVLSVGFQMSFAATSALVVMFQNIQVHGRGAMSYVKSLLVTTFVAGMATAPFIAYHFHILSKVGFVANLCAVPLTAFAIMPLGIGAMVLDVLFGVTILYQPLSLSIQGMFWIGAQAAHFQEHPMGIASPRPWVMGVFILGFCGVITLHHGRRVICAVISFAALGLWEMSERPKVIVHGDLIGVVTDDNRPRAIYPLKGNAFEIDTWTAGDGQVEETPRTWPAALSINPIEICDTLKLSKCDRLARSDGPFALYRHRIISAQDIVHDRLWINISE